MQARKDIIRLHTRLDLIKKIIAVSGRPPTQECLLRHLRSMGVKTSKGTVMNDLHNLGYCSAPSAYRIKSTPPVLIPA